MPNAAALKLCGHKPHRALGTVDVAHSKIAPPDAEIDRIADPDPLADAPDISRSRRGKLHTFADHRASMMVPIWRLPTELLQLVFLHHVAGLDPSSNLHLDRRPMILASVSRTWRNAALALPAIWSTIRFEFLPHSVTGDMVMIRLWLERAGKNPLSIIVSNTGAWSETASSPDIYAPIVKTFISVADRCRFIDTTRLPTWMSSELLNSPVDFPILQSLAITCVSGTDHSDIFRKAPNLRTLILKKKDIPEKPLDRILGLVLNTFSSRTVLNLLAVGANLQTLELPYHYQPGDPGPTPARRSAGRSVSLPHLNQLHIQPSTVAFAHPTADLFGRVFSALQLPALREVSVFIPQDRRIDSWHTSPHLLALLSRSPISKLTVTTHGDHMASPSDEDMAQILHALLELQTFILSGPNTRCMTEKLFTCMAYDAAKPMIAPLLNHIQFRYHTNTSDVDIAAFSEAMKSRAMFQPGVLRSVDIHCREEDLDRLQSPQSVEGHSLIHLQKKDVVVTLLRAD
ncbi:hypothetical protein HWV62_40292 [Athelia sp. TMB]|nr:hypothetical protein HWV62_40292 [Athelia sp. TMB]